MLAIRHAGARTVDRIAAGSASEQQACVRALVQRIDVRDTQVDITLATDAELAPGIPSWFGSPQGWAGGRLLAVDEEGPTIRAHSVIVNLGRRQTAQTTPAVTLSLVPPVLRVAEMNSGPGDVGEVR